jgi:serine/threonine-protein kinase RsbT
MKSVARRLKILTLADTSLTVVAVREMATEVGMRQGSAASLATAVSELTVNVVKYANSGVVTIRTVRARGQPGIEVVVQDRGPGIEDITFAMQDHASTGGTLGLGLPGTRRLVDEFEISSRKGEGTRVRIVKWA